VGDIYFLVGTLGIRDEVFYVGFPISKRKSGVVNMVRDEGVVQKKPTLLSLHMQDYLHM